jgi:hypothetical protein
MACGMLIDDDTDDSGSITLIWAHGRWDLPCPLSWLGPWTGGQVKQSAWQSEGGKAHP